MADQTAQLFIDRALTIIKYKAAGITLEDQEYSDAIDSFNDMMEELEANDIRLGFSYLTRKEEAVTIPDWARRFIKLKLAVTLAPEFGAEIPAVLFRMLQDSEMIINKRTMEFDEVVFPDNLPRGTTCPDDRVFYGNPRLDDVDTDVDAWIDDDGTAVEEDEATTGNILTGL